MEKPTPADVGQYYDKMNPFFETLWGDSAHFGYWTNPLDQNFTMAQAQRAFTDLVGGYLQLGPGQRGLDVGCGSGRPSIQIAEKTGAHMTGITISQEQARLAQERAQASACPDRLSFELIDAMNMPFEDNSFDAVLAFECMFHMPSRPRVFQEIARVVRPGGRVVVPDFVTLRPMTEREIEITYPTFAVNEVGAWDAYISEIKGAGLQMITCHDVTINTIRPTNTASLNNFQNPEARERLIATYGEEQTNNFFEWWKVVKEVNETLAYMIFVAEKPA